jgi:hypothetical protein
MMLLPGCPCCGPTCPECTHYSASDSFTGATVSITLDGSSVPALGSTPITRTPSGLVVSACFLPSDTVKQARFTYEYIPAEFAEDVLDANNCDASRVFAYINVSLRFINGECTYRFRCKVSRVTGECSETGGAADVGSWYAVDSDCGGGIPEDCRIEMLDWLSTLSVSASFSYAACECPP